MAEQKEVTVVSIDENKNITEKKFTVFLDDDGKEIARSKPTTQTIEPGDCMQRYNLLRDGTRVIVDAIHTPEVIAAYQAAIAELEAK